MNKAEKLRFLADRMEDEKEFYIGGYLSVYQIGALTTAWDETAHEWLTLKDSKFMINDMPLDSILLFDLKPKPQWEFTKDEKKILKIIDKQWKYLARDEDGTLVLYDEKPHKITGIFDSSGECTGLSVFTHLFQCIQWSDEEPCEFRKYL